MAIPPGHFTRGAGALMLIAAAAGSARGQAAPAADTATSAVTSRAQETSQLVQQTYTHKKVDGLDMRAEVFFDAHSTAPRAVIVQMHGGALMGGWRMQKLDRLHELFVLAGYAVVSIEYRLAPETKLPEIVADVRDAFRWVRGEGPALFGADPARVAAVGSSAGGYLALVSGYAVSPRPRAIVSLYGYGDILGKWYTEPDAYYRSIGDKLITEEEARGVVGVTPLTTPPEKMLIPRTKFYTYCRQQGIWPREVMGIDPHADPAAFAHYCPVGNVTADYPPTLLIHGEKDTDVPCEQSRIMAVRLRAAGVAHELALYPDMFHAFDGFWPAPLVRAQADDAFDRALRFVNAHTRPATTPREECESPR